MGAPFNGWLGPVWGGIIDEIIFSDLSLFSSRFGNIKRRFSAYFTVLLHIFQDHDEVIQITPSTQGQSGYRRLSFLEIVYYEF